MAPSGALAQLPPEQQACISRVNKAGTKVAAAQGKVNSTCLKNALKGRDPDPQECLTSDRKGRVLKATTKTFDEEGKWCAFPPSFGFAGADAVNQATISQEVALIADIFGSDLGSAVTVRPPDSAHPASGGPQGKCQASLLKAYDKLVAAKLKAFNSCKRAELKAGVADGGALQDACMGTGGSGIPDLGGKIEKAFSKLFGTLGKCVAKGVDLDQAFPGRCVGAPDFAQCVDARVECRVCLMLNAMDDINADCDVFDDGVSNFTCPGDVIVNGGPKCVIDPSSSSLRIVTQTVPLPPLAPSGAIDINCGSEDPGTGKAACDCELQLLDPILISAIGFICFTPGDPNDPCQTGEIDCDGGNALDVDMQSDHSIGICTGNVECAAQCAAYCAPAQVFNSACESFCVGGPNDRNPCTDDSDCPGGSCPGTPPHGPTCQCDCVMIDGGPSDPGGLQCNVSANIDVEIAVPCGDGDVLIAAGQRCIPLTTETVTSQMHNTNNSPGKDFPIPAFTASGAAIDCSTLATGATTGLSLVGAVNSFDSNIGDLQSQIVFTCQ
jgi:hypothetical protein